MYNDKRKRSTGTCVYDVIIKFGYKNYHANSTATLQQLFHLERTYRWILHCSTELIIIICAVVSRFYFVCEHFRVQELSWVRVTATENYLPLAAMMMMPVVCGCDSPGQIRLTRFQVSAEVMRSARLWPTCWDRRGCVRVGYMFVAMWIKYS